MKMLNLKNEAKALYLPLERNFLKKKVRFIFYLLFFLLHSLKCSQRAENKLAGFQPVRAIINVRVM